MEGSSSTDVAHIKPNQTIYVNNLNEKIKPDEVNKALYLVFGQFGNIVEVHCTQKGMLRGQAWVVFDKIESASRAVATMNSFVLYNKPMRVNFAKAKSDIVAKADNTFVARPKRKQDGDKQQQQQAKQAKKEKKDKLKDKQQDKDKDKDKDNKETKEKNKEAANGATSMQIEGLAAVAEPPAPPNKILFIENLPLECNDLMLGMLFRQYDGYKEVRMVPNKPGIAFVEFADSFSAGQAMNALQGFKLTQNNLMKISYAKK